MVYANVACIIFLLYDSACLVPLKSGVCKLAYSSRLFQTDRNAPIEWSPDSRTVERILAFCEDEIGKIQYRRRVLESRHYNHDMDVREAILVRIHGNLRHANYRAYPAEISFSTVSSDLTRHFDDSPDGLAMKKNYLVALESEWAHLQNYFKKNFPKPRPDWL